MTTGTLTAPAPFVFARGNTWPMPVLYKAPITGAPIDLTGSTVTGNLILARRPLPILLTGANGGLALAAAAGSMTFTLPAAESVYAIPDPYPPGAVPAGYAYPNRLVVTITDTLGVVLTTGVFPILVYDPSLVPIGAAPQNAAGVMTAAGAQGPAGPVAGILNKTATTAMPGHRVVKPGAGGVLLASQDQVGDAGCAIGVTLNAATAPGQIVQVATDGEVVESTWSWTPGPVWLGTNGALTQTAPTTGVLQQIGVATSPTSILVAIQDAIVRA